MEPSKEAVESIHKAISKRPSMWIYEFIYKSLEIAYAIDVAPLEKRIAELEKELAETKAEFNKYIPFLALHGFFKKEE